MRDVSCPLDIHLEEPNGVRRTEHEIVAVRSAEAAVCNTRLQRITRDTSLSMHRQMSQAELSATEAERYPPAGGGGGGDGS